MTLVRGSIPKFIERSTYNALMFGWVDAIRMYLPTVTVEKALSMFADRHNLSPDEFNADSAKREYYRMLDEMRDYQKEKRK